LTNRERHTDISFSSASDKSISKRVNNGRFHKIEEIGDDILEFEHSKSHIKLDIPIQIGFFVLEYAKLLILSFYYDFLVKFIPFEDFALIQTDTDSLYFSLSTDSLFLAVPFTKRKSFMAEYSNWFAKEFCDKHQSLFFYCKFNNSEWSPEECCQKVAKFDSRTVGKFHMEWKGEGVVALCSKAYYCIGDTNKYSSKGISKVHNQLTEKDYLHVLYNQQIVHGTNKGFRIRGNDIYTYVQQNRKALNFLYGKRVVQPDHITTLPTQL